VGNGEVTPPDATRSFSVAMPLTDGARGRRSGVNPGLRLCRRGRQCTADPEAQRPGHGQVLLQRLGRFLCQALEVPATPATTYRLEGVVEVHQDPGTDGTAVMDVLSVDASIKHRPTWAMHDRAARGTAPYRRPVGCGATGGSPGTVLADPGTGWRRRNPAAMERMAALLHCPVLARSSAPSARPGVQTV
jgi:hypothetical protein